MKNIHVLPTDKASRLFEDDLQLYYSKDKNRIGSIVSNHHIYITSDEEIKEDYVIAYGVVIKVMMFEEETLYFVNGTKAKREDCKKIILTTDQDLIKYGVQAIDDEFLEWFVKNPSCESVGVRFFCCGQYDGKCEPKCFRKSNEIIIPKEKPKQELEQELDIPSHLRWHNSKPKQETLEEAANNYSSNELFKLGFINGVKWQQERIYSEEDMRISFDANIEDWISFEEFIEQFKNK